MRNNLLARCICMGAVLALAAAHASADVNGNPLTITATTASGLTSSWTLTPSMGTWSNDGQDWTFNSGAGWRREFWSGGEFLGGLDQLTVRFVADPEVHVNFSTFGGAVPATFTFSSALLSFAPISGGIATATAGITLADVDGNGAFMNPINPGDSMYQANFNGLVPAGTNYAAYFSSTKSAFPGNSDSANSGPTVVPFAVSSMSAQFAFGLSANDLASGTSTFRLVPTPGVAGVLGLGLLMANRRRR
jgi:hypothetical protein